jgi:hypothetical protein
MIQVTREIEYIFTERERERERERDRDRDRDRDRNRETETERERVCVYVARMIKLEHPQHTKITCQHSTDPLSNPRPLPCTEPIAHHSASVLRAVCSLTLVSLKLRAPRCQCFCRHRVVTVSSLAGRNWDVLEGVPGAQRVAEVGVFERNQTAAHKRVF